MRPAPVLALLAGVLLAGAAGAQAPSVKLRHQRKIGDRWVRNETSNLTVLFNFLGTAADGTISSDAESRFEVAGVGTDGTLEIRRTAAETVRISGIPNAPAESKREYQPATFVQAPSGKLVRYQVPELVVDQQALMDASKLFSYEIEQLPVLEEFPEDEITAGQEWSRTYTIRGADGRDKKVTVKSRLFSYNPQNGEAWIVSESVVPGDMQFPAELANFTASGSSYTRSTYLFNATQGRMVRGTTLMHGDYQIGLEVNGMKLDISMTMAGSGSANQP